MNPFTDLGVGGNNTANACAKHQMCNQKLVRHYAIIPILNIVGHRLTHTSQYVNKNVAFYELYNAYCRQLPCFDDTGDHMIRTTI